MLEEEGILTTLRDEVTIQKGKVWRVHYWMFRREAIKKFGRPKRQGRRKKKEEDYQVYEELAENQWHRHECIPD
jgi:hypothetical protein